VKRYNKMLRQLLICHQSFEKLDFLQNNHHLMSAGDFELLFNKWDKEVTQLMLSFGKAMLSQSLVHRYGVSGILLDSAIS
jgi:hypothetical protein